MDNRAKNLYRGSQIFDVRQAYQRTILETYHFILFDYLYINEHN